MTTPYAFPPGAPPLGSLPPSMANAFAMPPMPLSMAMGPLPGSLHTFGHSHSAPGLLPPHNLTMPFPAPPPPDTLLPPYHCLQFDASGRLTGRGPPGTGPPGPLTYPGATLLPPQRGPPPPTLSSSLPYSSAASPGAFPVHNSDASGPQSLSLPTPIAVPGTGPFAVPARPPPAAASGPAPAIGGSQPPQPVGVAAVGRSPQNPSPASVKLSTPPSSPAPPAPHGHTTAPTPLKTSLKPAAPSASRAEAEGHAPPPKKPKVAAALVPTPRSPGRFKEELSEALQQAGPPPREATLSLLDHVVAEFITDLAKEALGAARTAGQPVAATHFVAAVSPWPAYRARLEALLALRRAALPHPDCEGVAAVAPGTLPAGLPDG